MSRPRRAGRRRRRYLRRQYAERRPPDGWSRRGACDAAVIGREEDRSSVWIQQDLFGVEAIACRRGVRTVHTIPVQRRLTHGGFGDTAVPDATCFVDEGIESLLVDGMSRIGLGVADERDAGRVTRIDGEVIGTVRVNP